MNEVTLIRPDAAAVRPDAAVVPFPEREWLTRREAAAYLEKSERHVQRLAQANLVVTKLVSRPGKKAETLYHAPELQLCKQEAVAAPVLHRMAEVPGALATHLQHDLTAVPATIPWATIIPEIYKHWTMAQESTSTSGHHWLTIDEAHAYCKVSKARILKAAQAGVLVAIRDGAWKVRRSSLETWDGTVEQPARPRKRH